MNTRRADGRVVLTNNIVLTGESEKGDYSRKFYIDGLVNAGSTMICYKAHHRGSRVGTLREYYPIGEKCIERHEDGRLYFSENGKSAARKRFALNKERYLQPLQKLQFLLQSEKENELARFIPPFEVFHDVQTGDNAAETIYIWIPATTLKTFEEVCNDIHSDPYIRPEQTLRMALDAIKKLTICVRELHMQDLVHRDLKPGNFGFMRRGGQVLTETITLFDIDSVCSVFEKPDEVVGTIGYLEPEARGRTVSNKTDIYSIGAILFHLLAGTEQGHGRLYNDRYYSSLHEIVEESKLIKASSVNSNPLLVRKIVHILEKSLAPRSQRYQRCEDLLEDLDDALFFLLPYENGIQARCGKKWILVDEENG